MIRLARNLVDTTLVTTTFELGGKEYFDEFDSFLRRDVVSRQSDDIGIVVLTSEASEWFVPAECSAYALVVVAGHGDTIAGRADGDTHVVGTILHGCRHRVREIWIVAAVGRWTAIVSDLYALLLEPSDNGLFECKACMITSNAEFKIFHFIIVMSYEL